MVNEAGMGSVRGNCQHSCKNAAGSADATRLRVRGLAIADSDSDGKGDRRRASASAAHAGGTPPVSPGDDGIQRNRRSRGAAAQGHRSAGCGCRAGRDMDIPRTVTVSPD